MIKLTYVNIDDFNRPVFKSDHKPPQYYGCTYKLFPYQELEMNVLETVTVADLTQFGSRFNCEPNGLRINPDDFEIVVKSVKKLKIKLFGRTKGAIGIKHTIHTELTMPVTATDEEIRLKLYENYEHIESFEILETEIYQ